MFGPSDVSRQVDTSVGPSPPNAQATQLDAASRNSMPKRTANGGRPSASLTEKNFTRLTEEEARRIAKEHKERMRQQLLHDEWNEANLRYSVKVFVSILFGLIVFWVCMKKSGLMEEK